MTKDIEWTPEKLDRLKELYLDKDDLSYKFIAERMTKEFGSTFSRSCISGKLSRMRMPLRGPRERVPMPIIKHSRKAKTWVKPARVPAPIQHRHKRGLQLIELEYGDCKWPSGTDVPYTFCGDPVANDGASYCQAHAEIAYNKPRRTWE
jgi:hypothetical protein